LSNRNNTSRLGTRISVLGSSAEKEIATNDYQFPIRIETQHGYLEEVELICEIKYDTIYHIQRCTSYNLNLSPNYRQQQTIASYVASSYPTLPKFYAALHKQTGECEEGGASSPTTEFFTCQIPKEPL
jgi:hypothetical protein